MEAVYFRFSYIERWRTTLLKRLSELRTYFYLQFPWEGLAAQAGPFYFGGIIICY